MHVWMFIFTQCVYEHFDRRHELSFFQLQLSRQTEITIYSLLTFPIYLIMDSEWCWMPLGVPPRSTMLCRHNSFEIANRFWPLKYVTFVNQQPDCYIERSYGRHVDASDLNMHSRTVANGQFSEHLSILSLHLYGSNWLRVLVWCWYCPVW